MKINRIFSLLISTLIVFTGLSQSPPANDDCSGAISLTPNTTCSYTPGTFSGAVLGPINCETGNHQDVWFQFIATSEINKITVTPPGGINYGFEIIEGSCTGTRLVCVDIYSNATTHENYTTDEYTIGNSYFIRVYNVGGSIATGNFNICVQSFPPPANDDCANALTLTPNTTCNYTPGTFSGASRGPISCETGDHQDVWFQFVATSEINKITVTPPGGINYGFEIIEGSCTGTSLVCVDIYSNATTHENYTTDEYTIGNSYFIRVYNVGGSIATGNFNICVQSFPPPANDDCANALTLTPNTTCNYTPGTFSGASRGPISCETGDHQDVWFQFVATSEINKITVTPPGGINYGFEIIEGSCTGTSLVCVDIYSNATTHENYTTDEYTIGNSYFIRVYNVGGSIATGNFNICVQSFPPPANDDCANALTLTPNTTCNYTPGTFSGASRGPISCETGDHQDVWFQFVATSETNKIAVTPPGGINYGFEIIEGSCTGTSMFCIDNFSNMSTHETFTSSSYTIGNTYFIRVYNVGISLGSGNFGICVESFPPPLNDNCANAVTLSPNTTCVSTLGTFSGASLGSITCEPGSHQSLWYKFVATEEINKITVTPPGTNYGFEIIDGSCTGTSMFCIDNYNNTTTHETFISDAYTIGNTYYIRVYNVNTSIASGDLNICVQSFPPPANDDCANAITVTPNMTCVPTVGTFSGASLGTINCETGSHQDVWYKFVATEEINKITVTPPGTNYGFEIIDGSCTGTSLHCIDNHNNSTTHETFTISSYIVGNTYYIRVYNVNTNIVYEDFSICIEATSSVSNDDCTDAVVLTPNTSCVPTPGSFNGSSLGSINCETGNHQDVWYKFTATEIMNKVTVTPPGTDYGFEIIDGSCTGTSIHCVDNFSNSTTTESFTSNTYIIGNIYYIRVYNVQTNLSSGNFDICVQSFTPPTNDECADAASLTVNTTCVPTTGTFSGAGQESSTCETGIHQSVWYKFVATNDTINIRLKAKSGLDHGFELLDACNGNSFGCTNNNGTSLSEEKEFNNLQQGNTYYVRVYNSNTGLSDETVEICVFGNPPTSGVSNLELDNDLNIYPNPSNTGLFTVSGNKNINAIYVLDGSGKTVFTNRDIDKSTEMIDLSAFKKGIYIIRIAYQEGYITKKIILN